jgi:hypothetical protein
VDEYLFITLAKLQADRAKLARTGATQQAPAAARQHRSKSQAARRWFARGPQWREQS